MSGPPPDPRARRRNAAGAFTTLPADGRAGLAPPYPLRGDDGRAERRAQLWSQLWATPAAALWDRHLWTMPVARYVEVCLIFEADPAAVSGALLTELRRTEEGLGLTSTGLLRARASIGPAGGAVVRRLAAVDLSQPPPRGGGAVVDLAAGDPLEPDNTDPA